MSSTVVEMTRAAHEQVERLERLVAKYIQTKPSTNKDRLYQSHLVRSMIDQITDTTHTLIEIYQDKDNARKDEIAALGGQSCSTSAYYFGNNNDNNVFNEFYYRLKEIGEYHRRHPDVDANVNTDKYDDEEFLKDKLLAFAFTGEESFGRYLDLHELYNDYINSKFGQKIDYSAYLDVFSEPGMIPRKLKLTRQYREYTQKLVEYLVHFLKRTQTLQDVENIFSKVAVEFEEQWSNGLVQGWENHENHHENGTILGRHLDYCTSVEQLMGVGSDKLKQTLSALGLKTGGTIRQRAERLFLTKNTPLENLDRKHFTVTKLDAKDIALLEAKMKKLCGMLHEIISHTKENIYKKHISTYNEIVREREEEDQVQPNSESDYEDDDEQQIKLHLGWDGQPTPYWLYKLHGLGHKFKCEICGDHTYRGRRTYERHFTEGRHQAGMKCLGIPNTKSFYEITSIKEANQLWEKLQEKRGQKRWHPDLEEEYEDQEGNIYNKKTYTDLKRQRLI